MPRGSLKGNDVLALKERIEPGIGKPSRLRGGRTEKWGRGRERESRGGLRDQTLPHYGFN